MRLSNPEQIEKKIHRAVARAIEVKGVCFRNVSQRFANQQDFLSAEGSKKRGGRFNFKGAFGVLYLSCDFDTCWKETIHTATTPAIDVAKLLPRTIVGVEVRLSKILDLTDNRVRRAIGITKKALTETDWKSVQKNGKEAITQAIGRFAKEAGFEAILVPSAVGKGKNLDIFPDNLLPSSQILVVNQHELASK